MKGNITDYLEIIVKYFQKRHPNIKIEWPNLDISIAWNWSKCPGDADTKITLGKYLQIVIPKDQEVRVKRYAIMGHRTHMDLHTKLALRLNNIMSLVLVTYSCS